MTRSARDLYDPPPKPRKPPPVRFLDDGATPRITFAAFSVLVVAVLALLLVAAVYF